GSGRADHIAAAAVTGGDDVHAIAAIGPAAVSAVAIVIGHALAAGVVVLELDGAGDGPVGAAVGHAVGVGEAGADAVRPTHGDDAAARAAARPAPAGKGRAGGR